MSEERSGDIKGKITTLIGLCLRMHLMTSLEMRRAKSHTISLIPCALKSKGIVKKLSRGKQKGWGIVKTIIKQSEYGRTVPLTL